MRMNYCLILLVPLLFSGCGEVDWFPENGNPATPANPASLTKSYSPAAILADADSTLTFTITNGTGNPVQSGLGFTDQLSTGLTATATPAQCGGTVSTSGSKITFSGGSLAAGATKCTITATVTGSTAGDFTNKTADITGLAGGLLNGVTDQTLKVFASSVTSGSITASHVTPVLVTSNAAESFFDIQVDVANSGAATANVTIDVVAVDSTGAIIGSTSTPVTGAVPPGGLTVILALGQQNLLVVPSADAAKIALWRIFSVH